MAISDDLTPSVAAVRALFGAAACSCALVDPDGATLTFVAADGAGAAEIVGVELPVGRGIAGWAVMSGQPIAVRDVRADPRFARDVAESTHYVPECILAAPMFDRRRGDARGGVGARPHRRAGRRLDARGARDAGHPGRRGGDRRTPPGRGRRRLAARGAGPAGAWQRSRRTTAGERA